MMSVTTKPEFSQPAIETSCDLFDWFDPIELGIRDRVLKRGKTPPLTTDQARVLLDSIDTSTVVGLGAWWYGTGSTRVYCGATVRVMAQGRSHGPPSVSPLTGVNPPRQRRARHGRP